MMFNAVTIKEVKNDIGALVKTMRSLESVTQEQLAERLGMSRITIQNLEAGKNATLDTVLKVLQYFDLLHNFAAYIQEEKINNNQPSLY